MERSLEYDLDFFYNQPSLILNLEHITTDSQFHLIKKTINDILLKHKRFYIITLHETIKSQKLLNNIIDFLELVNNKKDVEVYLSMTTSTSHKYFLNPLCSILHYKDTFNKALKETSSRLSDKQFFLNKSNRIHKTNKGILSIKTKNHQRELFYKKYNNNFDGIFRYENYKDVSFTNLMQEVKNSFVYFNFETLSNTTLNCFTEKSLLGFLSHTLPILYLNNDTHLKEFENMGFYLFNRDLGYINASSDIETNINTFVKYLETYNELSINDIQNIFDKNYNKIENNYQLAQKILFNHQFKNNKIYSIKNLL